MWDAWWDLVHGAECVVCGDAGRLLCPGCAAALPHGCRLARPTPCPPGLVPCFAAGEYAEPLRPMLLAHKEHRGFSLARPLGRVLAGVLAGLPEPGQPTVLVPVPSRPTVVRQRGHDPMLRIARAAAAQRRRAGAELQVLALLRQRLRVADQAGLDAAGRAANLGDSMAVAPSARRVLVRASGPAEVWLCDDVLTTGATAREAQRALTEAGIRVGGMVCIAATHRRAGESLPFSPAAH